MPWYAMTTNLSVLVMRYVLFVDDEMMTCVWWRNNDEPVTYGDGDDGVVSDDVNIANVVEVDGDDNNNVVNNDDIGYDFDI